MSMKVTVYLSIIVMTLSSFGGSNASSKHNQDAAIHFADHAKPGKDNSDISVAYVGGSPITVDVLRYYLAQKGLGSRSKPINKEQLSSILDEVISIELYKQAAIKNHLDKDPATVLSMTRILANKYQTDILAKNSNLTKVSDVEIKENYEKNKQRYTTPARRRGAIISVRLNTKSDAKERNKAKEKLKAASKSAAALKKEQKFFNNLAKRYSDDVASKSRRGDIGWIVEGATINRYEPVVIKTLFSLDKVGDVSSVVKGERGYYLVKLVDSKPSKQQTLKQVERTIYQNLLAIKRHVAESQIKNDLLDQFEISINDSVMNDLIEKINTRNINANNMPPSFPVSVENK